MYSVKIKGLDQASSGCLWKLCRNLDKDNLMASYPFSSLHTEKGKPLT